MTLDVEKKPQALSTPNDFSEYTVKNFPGYKTQQKEVWLSPSSHSAEPSPTLHLPQ